MGKTKTQVEAFKRDEQIEAQIKTALRKDKKVKGQDRFENGRFISSYDDDIGYEICVRVAHGQSLRFICNLPKMPTYWTLSKWLWGEIKEESVVGARLTQFRHAYAEAKQAALELLGDELVPVADEATDKDSAAAAKVKVGARQFKLERLNPKSWAQATRALEDDVVDNFAELLNKGLEIIEARREARLDGDQRSMVAIPAEAPLDGELVAGEICDDERKD